VFYDELCKLCSERGVTATELCRAIGISTGNTSSWKSGRVPKVSTLKAIAEYLHVPVETFIGRAEPLPQQTQLSAHEQRLMAYFQKLSPESAKQLLEFAEFLSAKEKAPSEDGANS
jgi:transcriptional regulator with XRE-family HTH domain